MADKQDQLKGRASIEAGTHLPGEGLQMTPSQKAAAGPQAEVETVSMEVLRDGSYGGEYRHVGDSVDVPESDVESLTLSGFAARADRVERAQRARDEKAQEQAEAEKKAASRKSGRSTAVAPMGTADMPGGGQPRQE